MRQAIQNWNMMYADIARSPESALRAFTSSEGLANQLNEDEVGEVGKLLKKIEMDATKNVGKLVKKIEMDAARSEKFVNKNEMYASKNELRKVWNIW